MTDRFLVPLVSLMASAATRDRLAAYADAGGVFAYPTDTVYGLGSNLSEGSVRWLSGLKQRPADKPFLIVSGRPGTFADLAWTPQARRLAETFWPGPMTLILKDPEGMFSPLLHGPGSGVAVRHSSHIGVRVVEWVVGSPLTSTSANPPGEPPALDALEALSALLTLGAPQAWAVDGGRIRSSEPSTLVDCTVDPPRVVREGTFSLQEVERVVNGETADSDIDTPRAFSILFVCTGNTCRSPLAEAIATRRLSELGWAATARSAGVFASAGAPASRESVAVSQDHGLDLASHAARPLDEALIQDMDLVLTMAAGHLDSVRAMGASGNSALLSAFADGSADPYDGTEVIDPFGQSQETYEATYDTLVTMIDKALARLAPVLAPQPGAHG